MHESINTLGGRIVEDEPAAGSFDPLMTKEIFLVHGEHDRSENFRGYLLSKGYAHVTVPVRGETALV